jgi:hypothetical protein
MKVIVSKDDLLRFPPASQNRSFLFDRMGDLIVAPQISAADDVLNVLDGCGFQPGVVFTEPFIVFSDIGLGPYCAVLGNQLLEDFTIDFYKSGRITVKMRTTYSQRCNRISSYFRALSVVLNDQKHPTLLPPMNWEDSVWTSCLRRYHLTLEMRVSI